VEEIRNETLRVAITSNPIDVGALHAEVGDAGAGAVLAFVGTVRNEKQGRRVTHIDYEVYAPMALKVLQRIGSEMLTRWPTRRAALVHRVGTCNVGETSVALLVATPHRAEGFAALRHGIEALKKDVPIWKKEHFKDGAVWVQEGS
jgi:molybdopterin synthase catalytic subunit